MARKRIDLCGQWNMTYMQHLDFLSKRCEPKTVEEIEALAERIFKADVPGNFELDLVKNGILEDPFYGLNIYKLRPYENCHVWYWREFDIDEKPEADCFLFFEGIDTVADVSLNGHLIGSPENMLIPHEFNINEVIKAGRNEILVHIKPVVIEARKYNYDAYVDALPYNYEQAYIRKAGHTYGWDIMCRAVSAGLWRPVCLEFRPLERIEDLYMEALNPGNEGGSAWCSLRFTTHIPDSPMDGYYLEFEGRCKDSVFKEKRPIYFTAGCIYFSISNVKLWWPKGKGEPNLYDVTVRLIKGDRVLDQRSFTFGVRSIKLDTSDDGFCFVVNGVKTFITGTNWVPIDAFHSRDRERLPKALALLDELGCNMVRCWGGNVYEDDIFYDFCDRHGIMIWQDFAMACGRYPLDEEFQRKLGIEAKTIVKRLRQHASLALWSGDNECDYSFAWHPHHMDPNKNVLTRKLLPEILLMSDPGRPYIPSSPYMDEKVFLHNAPMAEEHLWGPRDYYKSRYYTESKAYFASEIGYHGCPWPDSIKKFISPESIWPYHNREWFAHCTNPIEDEYGIFNYRVDLMANQIGELFGEIPDNIEAFALASQISQAEAKKFFIEHFRTNKWRKTGLIWWNLIDGWPQFSDAIVDYYYNKKLAFDYIKQSQQPVCIMLKEPEDWHQSIILANDTLKPVELKYRVIDITNDKVVTEGTARAEANSNVTLGRIKFSQSRKIFYKIEWETADKVKGCNHYLAGHPGFNLKEYVAWAQKAGIISLPDGYKF